ncbi:hypothetical protein PTKIN_Ptkin07bG0247100 [Pterospermum kingtungense]
MSTDDFFFAQRVDYYGFDPPQDNGFKTRRETHFFNMGCDGNGFRTSGLKQEERGENEPMKGPLQSGIENGTFWTVCPYCYYMYEYEKKYEECCLLCQHCRRGFHGAPMAAPPERLVVNGEEEYYCSGYGFFPLGYFGDGFLGDKKEEVGGRDSGKKLEVVEISDSSSDDEEEKDMDVKNEAGNVKAEEEGLSNGEGRGVMKRVKSVPWNSKKMMGRGVKGTIQKVSVVQMNVEFGNGVADIDCGSGGGIRLGSDLNGGCNEDDELEFFEGDDDIFVGLRDIC